MAKPIHFTGDPEADAFLGESPLALLIGFVLDQQVTVQKAFSSPLELSKRLGGLDAREIAAIDPEKLEEAFRERPALHRFPANMARRTQELCVVIAKRLGVRPSGWEELAPAWHSLGDVDSPEALVEYQAAKRAHKAALRAQQTA